MADNLTIDALLSWSSGQLIAAAGAADLGEARLDAELLLAHALSVGRTYLKTHPERVADSDTATRFREFVARRAAGEPVAYIVGYRDFWTFRLSVNSNVLIPRPETELIVERALALGPPGHAHRANSSTEPQRGSVAPTEAVGVADLGTGSGAIALALASERPSWNIAATDLSGAALQLARANAQTLGLRGIEFLQGPWFEPLAGRRFNLILSNPPYIAAADPALSQLRYEPQGALVSGADGMESLREIIAAAPTHLRREGWLLLEHGSTQAEAVARELVGRGFAHVRSHPDLAGNARVTEAQWV